MKKVLSRPLLRFTIFIFILIALAICGKYFSVDVAAINDYLKQIPLFWAGTGFVVFYVVGTFLLWYLKDPLKIVGALIFGAYISTALIYLAEVINAFIFFKLSYFLGKDFVEGAMRGKSKNFYEKLENLHLGWVFMLRAIPLIPYRVLDLSFGLSKFSFRKYLTVVLLASPPRIFWIQFILAGLRGLSAEKISACMAEGIGACFSLLMNEMNAYFHQNQAITFLSLVYYIVALVVIFKMKRKLQ